MKVKNYSNINNAKVSWFILYVGYKIFNSWGTFYRDTLYGQATISR